METKKIKFRLTGTTPLLMHNPRLANPLDPFTKAIKKISGKRLKTDADHEEMGRLEFLGSLYLNKEEVIAIPGNWIEGALIESAKKSKKGKTFRTFLFCEGMFPLEYDGPIDPEKLWTDGRFTDVQGVRVGQSRVMRTRPRFDEWAANIEVNYVDGSELDRAEIINVIKLAEIVSALGDGRPRFGRFTAEVIE